MTPVDGKPKSPRDPDAGDPPPAGSAPRAVAPGLHFVATPIGNARDITLRALDVLRGADMLAAEDTRSARRLLDLHAIPVGGRPLLAYHDHNGAQMRPRLLAALREGRSLAYVSDAGTPLVADPGYQLAVAAVAEGLPVDTAPGPSAPLAALTLAGLPSDRFLFAGFPPAQASAREAWLRGLDAAQATVILFESAKRVHRLLGECCDIFGESRRVALCRELTKRFQEVRRGTLAEIMKSVADDPPRGEIVLLLDRPSGRTASAEDIDAALVAALDRLRVKEAAGEVAEMFGLSRRDLYQRALELQKRDEDG